MTERQAALAALINSTATDKNDILAHLAHEWQHEPLLMYKWYQLQATAMSLPGEPPIVERVRRLLVHPGFSLANPNNVFALIRSFCMSNEAEFHRRDAPVTSCGPSRSSRSTASIRLSRRALRGRSTAGASSHRTGRRECAARSIACRRRTAVS